MGPCQDIMYSLFPALCLPSHHLYHSMPDFLLLLYMLTLSSISITVWTCLSRKTSMTHANAVVDTVSFLTMVYFLLQHTYYHMYYFILSFTRFKLEVAKDSDLFVYFPMPGICFQHRAYENTPGYCLLRNIIVI